MAAAAAPAADAARKVDKLQHAQQLLKAAAHPKTKTSDDDLTAMVGDILAEWMDLEELMKLLEQKVNDDADTHAAACFRIQTILTKAAEQRELAAAERTRAAQEEARALRIKLKEAIEAGGPMRPPSASDCSNEVLNKKDGIGDGVLYRGYPKSGCNHPVLLGIKSNNALLVEAMTSNRRHEMTQTLLYHALDFMTIVNEKPIGLQQVMEEVGLDPDYRMGLVEAPRVALKIDKTNGHRNDPKVAHKTMVSVQLCSVMESMVQSVTFKGVSALIDASSSLQGNGTRTTHGGRGLSKLGPRDLAEVVGLPGSVLQVAKNPELMQRDGQLQLTFGRRGPCAVQLPLSPPQSPPQLQSPTQSPQPLQPPPPAPARQRVGPLFAMHQYPLVARDTPVNMADVVVGLGLECPQAVSVILEQERLSCEQPEKLPLAQAVTYGVLQLTTLNEHDQMRVQGSDGLGDGNADNKLEPRSTKGGVWGSDVAGWPSLDPAIKGAERAWHLDKLPLLMPSGAFVQLWALLPQLRRATMETRLEWLPHLATVLDSVQVMKSSDPTELPRSGLSESWGEEVLRLAALLGAVALYCRYQALGELPAKGAPPPPAGTSIGWLLRAFKEDSCLFLPPSIGADDIEGEACGENAQGLVLKSEASTGAAVAAAAVDTDRFGRDSSEQPPPRTGRQSVYLKSYDYDLRHSTGAAKTKFSTVEETDKRQIMEPEVLRRLESPNYYGGPVKVFELSAHAAILQRPFLAGRCSIEDATEVVALLLQLDHLHKGDGTTEDPPFVFGDVRVCNVVVTDDACEERPQWLEQVHADLVRSADMSDGAADDLRRAEQRVRLIDCDFAGRTAYPKGWNSLSDERHPGALAGAKAAPEHDIYAAVLILETAVKINSAELTAKLKSAKTVLESMTKPETGPGETMEMMLGKCLFGDEERPAAAAGMGMGFQLSLWMLRHLQDFESCGRTSAAPTMSGSPPRDGNQAAATPGDEVVAARPISTRTRSSGNQHSASGRRC